MSLTQYIAETRAAAAAPEHPWDRAALDWPLTPESVVVEVGGFKGRWALQIAERYNPDLYVFEPQQWAAEVCREALKPYNAIVYSFGLGDHDGVLPMNHYETDGCTFISGEAEAIGNIRDAAKVLPRPVDLMLVNIEGYEYTLLPYLLDQGLLPHRLMVQWHTHATTPEAHAVLLARLDRHYGARAWDYGAVLMAWEVRR